MNISNNGKEAKRIREEYVRRDNLGLTNVYKYSNPTFLFHMQEREWGIIETLRRQNIAIDQCIVLEVGCGTGHILERWIEFGAGVAVGIDLMIGRLLRGHQRYPNLPLLQGNGAELPFASEVFDMVLQFTCLSSVLDPSARARIADEMWRVLRPGGIIVSYDLRDYSLLIRMLSSVSASFQRARRLWKEPEACQKPTPIEPLSLQEINRLFGKGSISCRSTSLHFRLASIARFSHLLAWTLGRLPCLRSHHLAIIRKPRPEIGTS